MTAQPGHVFISCVSDEFEKPAARFPGFRSMLAGYLRRADCTVKVQEDFRYAAELDTVEKLAEYIRSCQAVVHLPGKLPGSVANETARKAFLANSKLLGGKKFLADHPKLQKELGDCADLTYTQWEAFLAVHYGVQLFVYATEDAKTTQATHLQRLVSVRKFEETFRSDVDLLGKLIGDLRRILPQIAELNQKIANSRFLTHAAEDFLGRETELAFLDEVWKRGVNVLSLIAWGGVGKTSLVVRWIQQRFIDRQWKDDDTPALWRYFDWTFYDQGTGSLDDENANRTGNVGSFFEEALKFFGDSDPNQPGKGTRLAKLIQQQHSLLVLDGLEPLQAPPNSQQPGQLLDPDLHDLLVSLAQLNPGLCLMTSRQSIRDLEGLSGRAAESKSLDELTKETAIRLLRKLQITGTDKELGDACDKFDCHALSLTLLGRFLVDAHGGEIARVDRVNLHKADRITRPERHRTAWRVLEAYDEWLNSKKADPTLLAILRLTGLFDRPASADCLRELRQGNVIPDLTDAIHQLDDDEWNVLLKRLERAHLVRLRPCVKLPGEFDIDAHPLIREYFAEQLRTKHIAAFQAAHSRLFDYLCKSTEHRPDTLDGLQPLYQAVVHGCLAGRQQEALYQVYGDRIQRRPNQFFATQSLGAIGADLGAVGAFFEQPWTRLSPNLSKADQAWLFNEAAYHLRALGRLNEALEPMRAGLEMFIKHGDWRNAAISGSNLSALEVIQGQLGNAADDARCAIFFADFSGNAFWRMGTRAAAAAALHQSSQPVSRIAVAAGEAISNAGETPASSVSSLTMKYKSIHERDEARTLFETAEALQRDRQPQFDLLYSLQGFQYCDLILTPAERAAWRLHGERQDVIPPRPLPSSASAQSALPSTSITPTSAPPLSVSEFEGQDTSNEWTRRADARPLAEDVPTTLVEAERRATRALAIVLTGSRNLLSIALNHLTLARVALYRAAIAAQPPTADTNPHLAPALDGFRKASEIEFVAKALLTAAHWHALIGDAANAERYLAEAQQIAERGPMPLHLADVHLHRARLAARMNAADRAIYFPNVDPKDELAKAKALIQKHKYGRRTEELADAEQAILGG